LVHSLKKRIDMSKAHLRQRSERSLGDEVRFLKTLFESPRLTGAVSPSGRSLARAMARAVGASGEGLVVELGPGTGPVTRALAPGSPRGLMSTASPTRSGLARR